MIKLKTLICESKGSLSVKDIFNFYFLFSIASYTPEALKTDYGRFIQDEYLKSLKVKYMSLFKTLLYQQIQKYVSKGRIDPDFPKDKMNSTALDSSDLLELMKKTFRTDMKRRNDVWIMAAEFLKNLEYAQSSKDIYIWIDRLNSAIHNTQSAILGKVSHELVNAYDKVHHSKSVKEYEPFVDTDLKQLGNQELYERMIKLKKLLPEGIEMSPAALSKLAKPTDAPSSHATDQSSIVKKNDDKKDDLDKDAPPELKMSSLEENTEIDTAFFGNKKVSDQIPNPKKPLFKPLKKPDEKKKKEDDTDHFKLGALQEAMDTAKVSPQDRENINFMSGLKLGVQDKGNNRIRNLTQYDPDFQRGYNMVKREGWWSKFNDKLTDWAASLGSSLKK